MLGVPACGVLPEAAWTTIFFFNMAKGRALVAVGVKRRWSAVRRWKLRVTGGLKLGICLLTEKGCFARSGATKLFSGSRLFFPK